MVNLRYNNGANRERRIKKKLESEGWPLVIRSSGSHGVVDVIAVGRVGEQLMIRLIQSKASKSKYLTSQERIKKSELENKLGINVEVI